MAWDSDDLDGQWCSARDCTRALRTLESVLRHDLEALETAIGQATGRAKSILRGRWPDAWPFSTPPAELREATAVLAVYSAAHGELVSSASYDAAEQLRLRRKETLEWLNALRDGDADLELPSLSVKHSSPALAEAPRGEFGFR